MTEKKTEFPIGFVQAEEQLFRPFVLDWSDKAEAEKIFAQSTQKVPDTCFTQMVTDGHIPAGRESVGTTGSSLGGETVDTTIEF